MLIYKIFRADEWATLQIDGETVGAPIDVADGYIHFSTADDLVLLAVEPDNLAPLKWEPARDDVLFPHLYRKLRMEDVVWSKPLPLRDGAHQFPDLS